VIERTGRLEWNVPNPRGSAHVRLIQATPEREPVATS
jgi:hypothetical protein